MVTKNTVSLLAVAMAMSACSTSWLPWSRSDKEQPHRLPEGAVELQCAQGKTLVVRHAPDGKSVWIHFPDRVFRLDRTAPSPNERYSNATTTMVVEADGIALDVDGARQFTDCKRKAQP